MQAGLILTKNLLDKIFEHHFWISVANFAQMLDL